MSDPDPAAEAARVAAELADKAKRNTYQRIYYPAWAARNPEKMAAYRERTRERMAAYRATDAGKAKRVAWKKANPDKVKAYAAAQRDKPRDKEAERRRKAEYEARPEVKQRRKEYNASPERQARMRARCAAEYATPIGCLSLRMSVAVRWGLKLAGVGKKPGSKWLDLVGYTAEQLKAHIERQFVRGMGWHNMPEWHIDHIVPLSSFKFTSQDDPEFKAAWALTNLRPLWGPLNVKKHARREFLL